MGSTIVPADGPPPDAGRQAGRGTGSSRRLCRSLPRIAYLVLETAPETGKRYELLTDQATIGRHPDCEVAVKDALRVSRYHAQILRRGEEFFLKDLNSRNKTYLNDQEIDDQPRLLSDGDRLAVCDVLFTFHDETLSRRTHKPAGTVSQADLQGGVEGPPLLATLVDDDPDTVAASSNIMSSVDVSTGARVRRT